MVTDYVKIRLASKGRNQELYIYHLLFLIGKFLSILHHCLLLTLVLLPVVDTLDGVGRRLPLGVGELLVVGVPLPVGVATLPLPPGSPAFGEGDFDALKVVALAT